MINERDENNRDDGAGVKQCGGVAKSIVTA